MFEIKGFDGLNKTLDELQKLTNELEGELGTIEFDANSAESIEMASAHDKKTKKSVKAKA